MIPKTIHYCWFGHNPKPKLAEKCIASWKKYCPDYQIIEWNEANFDISSCPLYVRQAYDAKKWAFVTDYVRLFLIYTYGGIYMDTDVELRKSLDPLLQYNAYFGYENHTHIATGLGFGSIKGSKIILNMMNDYNTIPFILENGSFDTLACPYRNTHVLTEIGLRQDNSLQILEDSILILPTTYLCPIEYRTGRKRITKETISIHWFTMTWKSEDAKKIYQGHSRAARRADFFHGFVHLPNYLVKKAIGENYYAKLKKLFNKN